MKTPFSSSGLTEPMRRRVDMAVAVAHERLLSTHVAYALDLVALAGDRVPFDDTLDIYTRMLRLSSEEAGVVTTRALATLGRRAGESEPGETEPVREPEADAPERDDGRSFLSRVRQRLRGRIDEDLRFLIELEVARAEEALLYTHIENALHFIGLLEDGISAPEAVDLYLDALDVRESISEVIYHLTLSRLGDRYLPAEHRRKTGPEPGPRGRDGEEHAASPELRVVQTDSGG